MSRPKGNGSELQARRVEALRQLREGKSVAEVAAEAGVHVGSVYRWQSMKDKGGHAALRARPNTGRPCRLTDRQKAKLTGLLLDGALANGFPTDLWTCPRIVTLIKRNFGVDYHHDHVGRLMAAMGFTCQKPKLRAAERDEAAVEHWVRHDWEAVKKKRSAAAPGWCSSTKAGS
jgi:transposase